MEELVCPVCRKIIHYLCEMDLGKGSFRLKMYDCDSCGKFWAEMLKGRKEINRCPQNKVLVRFDKSISHDQNLARHHRVYINRNGGTGVKG